MNASRPGRLTRALLGACAALAWGLGAPVWAGPGAHYYDGAQSRGVTLQPDLVAEFVREGAPATARPLAAGAVPLAGVGDSMVRIYRLPQTVSKAAVPTAGSPVYREGSSPAGRLMALPGGVLVKFKPEWSRAQIDAWLAGRGLAVQRPLAAGGNWFLVATPAGEASLATANALYESGEVLAASPNWWKQTVTR